MHNVSGESHIGELAELYVLGSLGAGEARDVEHHVMLCGACASRLNDAVNAAARCIDAGELVDAPPELRARIASAARAPRASAPRWASIAAAFLLGLLPSVWLYAQHARDQRASLVQAGAISALTHSHFLHAPMQAVAPDAPAAKVIFPRDRSWVYVVIAAPAGGLQVGDASGGNVRVIGSAMQFGNVSAYYGPAYKGEHLVIVRRGAIVDRAPRL